MSEARSKSDKTTGALAVTVSTAALACGVCCVLPFALPAAALASFGGVLAWLGLAYNWLTPIAIFAVGAGWIWVGVQSWRSRRPPARLTITLMTIATIVMAVAWIWPIFETWLVTLIRR